jgi:hypothetical protein
MLMVGFLGAFLGVFLGASWVHAAPAKPSTDKRSVTLLPVMPRGSLSQKAAKGITVRMRDALGGVEGIQVLEATKDDDRINRQCGQASDDIDKVFDLDCLRDAMFVRQATRLAAGIVAQGDGGLVVTMIVIDKDGAGIQRKFEARFTDDGAPEPVDRFVRELFAEETLRGSLVVEGNDGDAVFLDGKAKGVLPLQVDGLREGSHELVVRRSGYSDFIRSVDIRHAETTTLTAVLIPGASRADVAAVANDEEALPIGAWATMAGGVALVGVGIGAGVWSLTEAQGIEELAAKQLLFLPQEQDRLTRGSIASVVSNIGYIAGVAAIVGGGAWWLLGAASAEAEASAAAQQVEP